VDWLETSIDALARQPAIGYAAADAPATEPTALAALALVAHGRIDAAQVAAQTLASWQQPDGDVSIRAGESAPGWPTSLAVLAWCHCDSQQERIDRGIAWLLANRGKGLPRAPELGHNSELVGWAYAEQTHSWVEPTALAILALKAAGKGNDPACREGIAVLLDRQLPGGGLNYGNTSVLGQLLRAHVQPTGMALVALAGEADSSNRLPRTVAWLSRHISPETTPISLAWALLGLKAHGAEISPVDDWLAAAAEKVVGTLRVPSSANLPSIPSDGTRSVPATLGGSPHKLALLTLAAKGWPA